MDEGNTGDDDRKLNERNEAERDVRLSATEVEHRKNKSFRDERHEDKPHPTGVERRGRMRNRVTVHEQNNQAEQKHSAQNNNWIRVLHWMRAESPTIPSSATGAAALRRRSVWFHGAAIRR